MLFTQIVAIFMYWTCNSMDNLLSYCGLVDEKISASEKDLPVPWEIVEVWPSSVCVTIKPIWVIFQIWRTAELSVRQEHKISLEKIKNSPDNGKKLTDSVLDWKSEKYKDILSEMLVSTTSPTATRKLHIESLFHDWIDVGCSNHWLQSKIYLQLKHFSKEKLLWLNTFLTVLFKFKTAVHI